MVEACVIFLLLLPKPIAIFDSRSSGCDVNCFGGMLLCCYNAVYSRSGILRGFTYRQTVVPTMDQPTAALADSALLLYTVG